MDLILPESMRGWSVVRLIGEGSYGKVYEIARTKIGIEERSALKVISIPASMSEVRDLMKNEGLSEDSVILYYKEVVRDLTQEIALMSRLKGNTNIVSCEDYEIVERKDTIGWDIFIKMELLEALPDYISHRELTEGDVVKLGVDVCNALEACYDENIVHRDVKPNNVFVNRSGDFKLGDFGVARTIEKTVSGLSKKGTYTFMAPEVYKGEPYGATADLYSLGLMLYRLMNDNREPFLPPYPQTVRYTEKNDALVRRIGGEKIMPPRNASRAFSDVILKACAYDPSERFGSASEMKAALSSLAALRGDGLSTLSAENNVSAKPPVKSEPERSAPVTTEDDRTYAVRPAVPAASNGKANTSQAKKKAPVKAIIGIVIGAIIVCGIALFAIIRSSDKSVPLKKAQVGDIVKFGKYEQDNNTRNGMEDIEWLVLDRDGDKALVISRYALDCQKYNASDTDVTWETCSLRKWLNEAFFYTAFSSEEQDIIISSTVTAGENPGMPETSPGNDTIDKVFLLSVLEAKGYFISNEDRKCAPTDYTMAKIPSKDLIIVDTNIFWWLRSPGYLGATAQVYPSGEISYGGPFPIDCDYGGVRPAMWIRVDQ